jgi:hypothetical protein
MSTTYVRIDLLNGAANWHSMIEDLEEAFSPEEDRGDWHKKIEIELYERLDGRELYRSKSMSHPTSATLIGYETLDYRIGLWGHPLNSGYEWEWRMDTWPRESPTPPERSPVLAHYEVRLSERGVDVYHYEPGDEIYSNRTHAGKFERDEANYYNRPVGGTNGEWGEAVEDTGVLLTDEEGEAFLRMVHDMVPVWRNQDEFELNAGPKPIALPPGPQRDPGSGGIPLPPAPSNPGS